MCFHCFTICPDSSHIQEVKEEKSEIIEEPQEIVEPTEEEVKQRILAGTDTPEDWHYKRLFASRKNLYNYSGDESYLAKSNY